MLRQSGGRGCRDLRRSSAYTVLGSREVRKRLMTATSGGILRSARQKLQPDASFRRCCWRWSGTCRGFSAGHFSRRRLWTIRRRCIQSCHRAVSWFFWWERSLRGPLRLHILQSWPCWWARRIFLPEALHFPFWLSDVESGCFPALPVRPDIRSASVHSDIPVRAWPVS